MAQRAVAAVCAVLVALALTAAAAAAASASASSPLDHTPTLVGDRTYRASVHYTHPSGRFSRLTYQVTHRENVVSLPLLSGVSVQACSVGTLVLQLASGASVPAFVPGGFVVGDASAGCVDAVTGAPAAFYAEVLSVSVDGSTVTLQTRAATLTDVLEDAQVSFGSNNVAENAEVVQIAPSLSRRQYASEMRRREAQHKQQQEQDVASRGWFSHAWHDVTHVVHTVVHDVSHVVGDVVHTVADAIKLLEGNLDLNKNIFSKQLNWNYDAASQSAARVYPLFSESADGAYASGECSSCYLHADAVANFQLQISHYHLEVIEVTLTGDATAFGEVTARAGYGFSRSGSFPVATISLPSINFMAGPVPIHISFSIPVEMQWSASLSASAQSTFQMKLEGQIAYGVAYGNQPGSWQQYQGADGSYGWHHLAYSGFSHTGNAAIDASVQADATAAVVPVLKISIDGLGGPEFTLKPWVSVDVQVNDNVGASAGSGSAVTWSNSFRAQAYVYAGVDVSISAEFHVPIIDKSWTFGPYEVLDYKRLVWTRTWTAQSGGRAAAVTLGGRVPLSTTAAAVVPGPNDAARPAVPAAPTSCPTSCVIAQGLSVCAHLNGQPVCAASIADALVSEVRLVEFLAELAPAGQQCVDSMAEVLCNTHLPLCSTDTSALDVILPQCTSSCVDTVSRCGGSTAQADIVCSTLAANPLAGYADASTAPECASSPQLSLVSGAAQDMQCVQASGLSTCAAFNGRSVAYNQLLFGSLSDVDALVQQFLLSVQTVNGALSAACVQAQAELACAEYLPECSVASGAAVSTVPLCASSCEQVLGQCSSLAPLAPLCSAQAAGVDTFAGMVAPPGAPVCGHAFLAERSAAAPSITTSQAVGIGIGSGLAGALLVGALVVGVACVVRRRNARKRSALGGDANAAYSRELASPLVLQA